MVDEAVSSPVALVGEAKFASCAWQPLALLSRLGFRCALRLGTHHFDGGRSISNRTTAPRSLLSARPNLLHSARFLQIIKFGSRGTLWPVAFVARAVLAAFAGVVVTFGGIGFQGSTLDHGTVSTFARINDLLCP